MEHALRQRGKVAWFSDAKGYGFIEPEFEERDVFCHHTDLLMGGRRFLLQGQLVEFEVRVTPKGARAVNVRVILT